MSQPSLKLKSNYYITELQNYRIILSTYKDNFWLRQGAQGVTLCVCLSVHPSGTSLSKALNLHLSLIGLSKVSLKTVSGQSQVSFILGLFQVLCQLRQTDGA